MLEELTPEEVLAIVHLLNYAHTPGTNQIACVFVGNTLTTLTAIPGLEGLAKKIQEAGEREDVKEYMDKVYGTNDESEETNDG